VILLVDIGDFSYADAANPGDSDRHRHVEIAPGGASRASSPSERSAPDGSGPGRPGARSARMPATSM
jgi:hypothetical protein